MKALLLIIASLISLNLYSQEKKIEYFNKNWEPSSKIRAAFHREILKSNDSLFIVTDFQKEGQIYMRGEYSSIEPMVEHGYFEFFDLVNYKKSATGYYTNGEMTGEWHFFDRKGKVNKKVSYDLNLIYEPKSSIELPASESVSEGDSGIIIVDKMPRFRGNESDFFRNYIALNMVYPPMAAWHGIGGRVFVQFVINKSGKVTDINVVKSANKDLEREAIRVVSESPEWTPGYHNGEAIRVRFTFPINFVLQ